VFAAAAAVPCSTSCIGVQLKHCLHLVYSVLACGVCVKSGRCMAERQLSCGLQGLPKQHLL
jgi:hypothetical protein